MRKIALVIIVIIQLSLNNDIFALSIETHRAINSNIVKSSLNGFSLDQYLKSNLGIMQGIEKIFDGRRVDIWVELGGAYEDDPPSYTIPYRRSRNHFHNPLLPLDQAGYTSWGSFCDVGHCPVSAVLWALGPQNSDTVLGFDLNPGGDWSWKEVRNSYRSALTATNLATRNTSFANTFRGLGHLMHLVQDISVPEHTRNDGHYTNDGGELI